MSTAAHPEGLRARKRAETSTAIQRAAIALAEEHGYDAVTVEEICAEAGVSAGTFYNYFRTKEGVFLGADLPWPSEEAIEEFVQSRGNVLTDLIAMVGSAFAARGDELLAGRRRVVMRTPALAGHQIARFATMERRMVDLVLRRFEAQGRGKVDDPTLRDEARAVVGLGGTIHRLTADSHASRDVVDHIRLIHRLTATE